MEAPSPATDVAVAQVGARSFPLVNLLLFAATIASTLYAGSTFAIENGWAPAPRDFVEQAAAGLPFAVSLLGILVAHEMGHFVAARLHRVDASWPYFIPVPLGIGTFGAIIRMRGRISTRNALIDIGASGPLAGALVAIPVLLYGISLSRIEPVPVSPNFLFGNLSGINLVRAFFFDAQPWGEAMSAMEPQPLLYVLVKKLIFDVGMHEDVFVHPVAYAAVIGLYVTALNLVPIGQLDGGHVAFAVFGKKAEKLGRAFSWLLLAMVLFSSASWLLWLLLVRRFVGLGHPPIDLDSKLSRGRWVVVYATVLLFVLTLTPVAMDLL